MRLFLISLLFLQASFSPPFHISSDRSLLGLGSTSCCLSEEDALEEEASPFLSVRRTVGLKVTSGHASIVQATEAGLLLPSLALRMIRLL